MRPAVAKGMKKFSKKKKKEHKQPSYPLFLSRNNPDFIKYNFL